MKNKKNKSKKNHEIRDYDSQDFGTYLSEKKSIKLRDIGIELLDNPPTQVVSIRLPTPLVNEIRAEGSKKDISYQMLMKQFLFEGLKRYKKVS
jgi:predicted DNA binding CopG/RHH family protein